MKKQRASQRGRGRERERERRREREICYVQECNMPSLSGKRGNRLLEFRAHEDRGEQVHITANSTIENEISVVHFDSSDPAIIEEMPLAARTGHSIADVMAFASDGASVNDQTCELEEHKLGISKHCPHSPHMIHFVAVLDGAAAIGKSAKLHEENRAHFEKTELISRKHVGVT